MAGWMDMLKNTKALAEKAREHQAQLASKSVVGVSAAGLVKATVNGLGELTGLEMDPSLLNPDDPEMLADLIIAAVGSARKNAQEMQASMLQEMTGGLDLSAFGLQPGV